MKGSPAVYETNNCLTDFVKACVPVGWVESEVGIRYYLSQEHIMMAFTPLYGFLSNLLANQCLRSTHTHGVTKSTISDPLTCAFLKSKAQTDGRLLFTGRPVGCQPRFESWTISCTLCSMSRLPNGLMSDRNGLQSNILNS